MVAQLLLNMAIKLYFLYFGNVTGNSRHKRWRKRPQVVTSGTIYILTDDCCYLKMIGETIFNCTLYFQKYLKKHFKKLLIFYINNFNINNLF